MVEYVSFEEVIAIYRRVILATGGDFSVINDGLLKLLLGTVTDLVGDLADKAAHLLHGLVTGHPLANGNKRVALVTVELFLRKNGYKLKTEPSESTAFMLNLAAGKISKDKVRAWIKLSPCFSVLHKLTDTT